MKNTTLAIKNPILFLTMLLCAAIMSLQTVSAATITVTSTADSGAGTLRQALANANDGDTIDFSVTGTITLSSGELSVNDSITISGPGANVLAVSGNHVSGVFFIATGKTVTISGLTITNGTLGIENNHATLTISNSTVSGNSNNDGGGGIENDGGTLAISNSTLSGNSANAGGGIFSAGGMLTISNSTLSGNSAVFGGGIFNDGRDGSAPLTISNSTLSGNSATAGAGIFNEGAAATTTITDTILNPGAIFNENNGTVTSHGYNLCSDAAGGDTTTGPGGFLNATGDVRNTDPKLGPLADNGGPTQTHALLPGSPAVDKGKNVDSLPTDQRGTGFARTYDDPANANATGGDGTDIGAFEVQAANTVCPQPQGYWKNNPDLWPAESLMLGSQTYTKAELLTILNTPIGAGKKADASLILADQVIATKLNIANGADGTPVQDTIDDADTLLSGYGGKLPYHVRPNSTNGQQMVNDAATLESFNKAMLTIGCGG